MPKEMVAEQKTTHTLGPWRAVPSSHQREFTHWIERPAADGLDRLTVAAVLNKNDSEANARLIATAPRLFDALNGMVGLVQLVENERPDLQSNHRFVEALAAIAEAEGKA